MCRATKTGAELVNSYATNRLVKLLLSRDSRLEKTLLTATPAMAIALTRTTAYCRQGTRTCTNMHSSKAHGLLHTWRPHTCQSRLCRSSYDAVGQPGPNTVSTRMRVASLLAAINRRRRQFQDHSCSDVVKDEPTRAQIYNQFVDG